MPLAMLHRIKERKSAMLLKEITREEAAIAVVNDGLEKGLFILSTGGVISRLSEESCLAELAVPGRRFGVKREPLKMTVERQVSRDAAGKLVHVVPGYVGHNLIDLEAFSGKRVRVTVEEIEP